MTTLILITTMLTAGLTGDARDVMEPVVRVNAPNSIGSGVVVKSDTESTFILTNYHVIAGSVMGRYVEGAFLEMRWPVTVERYRYSDGGKTVEIQQCPAEIRAYSEEWDLALLEVPTDGDPWPVATLLPDDEPALTMLETIWAVGCAVGDNPICTIGHVMGLKNMIDGQPFILVSAQIIYGNSGGAAFVKRAGKLYLIGIPSRIKLLPNGIPLPYMGLVIPPERVRAFLSCAGVGL